MGLDSILWLAAVVVFIAVEAATTTLVSVWFAAGALAALLLSLVLHSLVWQFLVFAAVSAVALAVLMPKLKKKGNDPLTVTNGPRLALGKQGTVLRAIEPGIVGRVRVDGLDWQAVSDEPLPVGARCKAVDVEGNVLQVCSVSVDATV